MSILTQPLSLRHDYGNIHDLSENTSRLPEDVAITAGETMKGHDHHGGSDGSYMSVGYLKALSDKSDELLEYVHQDTPLPDWVEAKIGQAANAINSVRDYFVYRDDQDEEPMQLEDTYTMLPRSMTANVEPMLARHEEGKKMTMEEVVEDLTPEGKKKFVSEHEKNKDKFTAKASAKQVMREDKATEILVDMIGVDKSFRLMRLWQSAQQAASGNAFTLGAKVDPVELFVRKAREYHYPDKAIAHYIVHIQGKRLPKGLRLANSKVAVNLPADVERYVKEIEKKNPDYDEAQTWATAWSIYCKYKEPGSPHCQMPTSDYFKQADSSLTASWGTVLAGGDKVTMADWSEGHVIDPAISGPNTPPTDEGWGSDTPDGDGNKTKRAAEGDEKDGKEAKFEEGVPADPTKNMSAEDKAKWEKQNAEHADEFKKSARVRLTASEDSPLVAYENATKKAAAPATVQGWLEWEG